MGSPFHRRALVEMNHEQRPGARAWRAALPLCAILAGCTSGSDDAGQGGGTVATSVSAVTSTSTKTTSAGTPAASTTSGQAGSDFDLVHEGNTYTATSQADPGISVVVDCDDATDDGNYFGITPTLHGRTMTGPLWDTQVGLVLHDDDASFGLVDANRCASVDLAGGHLRVAFLSGTYKNLSDGGTGPDEPVPMNADIYVDTLGRLTIELAGLYYILPTVADTSVSITTQGAVQDRIFQMPTTATLEYFDDVTQVRVQDSLFGGFTIETNAMLLQLQHDLAYARFELDFDHAYKDKGQATVTSKIVFD